MPRELAIAVEHFALKAAFTIARGSKTEAIVVRVRLGEHGVCGQGECVPYGRYGESPGSVVAQIEAVRGALEEGLDRTQLQHLLAPGAARNAIDCALWDLAAKRARRPAFELAGLAPLAPVVTAFTLSLDRPEAMAAAAEAEASRPLLKLKLGGDGDPARLAAVRSAAPRAALIVDANESWTPANLAANLAACESAGVSLVEQPLKAGEDQALAEVTHNVPICADESVHDRHGLLDLRARYQAINIKLDKTGGLTEALALAEAARGLGLDLMIGCMVATSLAMAPALLLAANARFVDLDGPLLLAKDRPNGLRYEGSRVYPPDPLLWG
jgi:L-alanine-DL-glutamate epimerase-like enolase superfamily enzyme